MSVLIDSVSAWFWNEDVWLPPRVTWSSMKSVQIVNGTRIEPKEFAQFSDLLYPLPLAVIMLTLRWVVQKLFHFLGKWFGLKEQRRLYPADNPTLESTFRKCRNPKVKQLESLAKKSGLSYLQAEHWFRQRRQAELPTTLQKFCETGWRCAFYTFILMYGTNCLWDKAWLWDIRHCWYNYPFHRIDNDVWWYYMLELSFYWSLSISQFFDVKRKDFWEMFIHHNTTIALMMFSWTAHFTRIGTLVMIIHDCADPLLELAKLFRYAGFRKTCDSVFLIFSIIWVVTRCGLYPSWILYSTLYGAAWYIEFFAAYYIFNSLLVTLQFLHILWTYFLFKAIYKALVNGGIDDQRSDSEASEDENENEVKKVD